MFPACFQQQELQELLDISSITVTIENLFMELFINKIKKPS
jgi:hypothetical protein